MKRLALFVVPLLVIGGVVGAALLGYIRIPGLSPQKSAKRLMYGEPREETVVAKPPPSSAPAPPRRAASRPPTDLAMDLDAGAKRVARLWNEIPTDRLVAIATQWGDEDLARVLMRMDGEKAANLLSRFDAARSARLSRTIQRLGSRPETNK